MIGRSLVCVAVTWYGSGLGLVIGLRGGDLVWVRVRVRISDRPLLGLRGGDLVWVRVRVRVRVSDWSAWRRPRRTGRPS